MCDKACESDNNFGFLSIIYIFETYDFSTRCFEYSKVSSTIYVRARKRKKKKEREREKRAAILEDKCRQSSSGGYPKVRTQGSA
jgi:hypothetical protein